MSDKEQKPKRFDWTKSFVSGVCLGSVLGYNLYCLHCYQRHDSIIWPINWCCWCILYTSFHLIEFFLTSIYRPNELCFDSFLINQSEFYVFTTVLSIVEFWIEVYFFPQYKVERHFIYIGFIVSLSGLILRAVAEIKMEANFSHMIRREKSNSHQLVTTGVYSVFRHPSYTGWYYFLVGREILLQNPIGFLISSLLNWIVLQARIVYEEKQLRSMFAEYDEYSKHTHIMIPFMSVNCRNE